MPKTQSKKHIEDETSQNMKLVILAKEVHALKEEILNIINKINVNSKSIR